MNRPARTPQSNATFALLENLRDAGAGALLFTEPVQHVVAWRPEELAAAFAAIESYRRAGLHSCGYVAYEAGYHLADKYAFSPPGPAQLPLLGFHVFARSERLGDGAVEDLLDAAGGAVPVAIHDFRVAETRSGYEEKIARIREYIRDGDTYQVNFTFRCRFRYEGAPIALYTALRRRQRAGYAAFLNFPEARIVSLSPELFVRKTGGAIESKPMKGTAGRGRDASEDAAIVAGLRTDPKTISENVMIVDMIRNDFGRIALPGSVAVDKLFEVQSFETLHQVISTVHGEVDPRMPVGDAFRHLFPCGSITGAPKLRTMQIIQELESEPRGVYTGAIGYVTPQNDFCFSVPIRTIVSTEERDGEMGIGSGIVHESETGSEYEECLLKARFLTGINEHFQLIETMAFDGDAGEIRNREMHWARVKASAECFGFRFEPARVAAAIDGALTPPPGPGIQVVRLLLHHDGRVEVRVSARQSPPAGERWLVASRERVASGSIFQRHKTSIRGRYERAYAAAAAQGAYDVLFLNERGEIAEASRHNVLVERNGMLWTPPADAGALPGVGRACLLRDGVAREARLLPEDLERPARVYLVNAVRGLVEVRLHPSFWETLEPSAEEHGLPDR